MSKMSAQWVAHVEAKREEMNALMLRIKNYGASVEPKETRTVGDLPYIIQFIFPDHEAIVTMEILLLDHQTDSDVVITHLTTLPINKWGNGLASTAIQTVLRWAIENNLKEVRATQVHHENERFWQRNRFTKCLGPNPCNDFIFLTNQ